MLNVVAKPPPSLAVVACQVDEKDCLAIRAQRARSSHGNPQTFPSLPLPMKGESRERCINEYCECERIDSKMGGEREMYASALHLDDSAELRTSVTVLPYSVIREVADSQMFNFFFFLFLLKYLVFFFTFSLFGFARAYFRKKGDR